MHRFSHSRRFSGIVIDSSSSIRAVFGKGFEAGERFVAESIVFVVDVGDAVLSDTSRLRRLLLALSGLSDLLGNGEPN